MGEIMWYHLHMTEIIPVEVLQHRIGKFSSSVEGSIWASFVIQRAVGYTSPSQACLKPEFAWCGADKDMAGSLLMWGSSFRLGEIWVGQMICLIWCGSFKLGSNELQNSCRSQLVCLSDTSWTMQMHVWHTTYLYLNQQIFLLAPRCLKDPNYQREQLTHSSVWLYNFLYQYGHTNLWMLAYDDSAEMMSFTYQLQMLWYQVSHWSRLLLGTLSLSKFCLQAMWMYSLGWGWYLKVELLNGNKTLSVSYWV